MKRRYAWIPDKLDPRDKLYRKIAPPRTEPLPDSVDLRSQMSPVEDQGQLGSCVWNSLVATLEFLEIKQGEELVNLSRLFGYYNTRVIENDINEDNGCQIRDGVKSLSDQGVCPEVLWPYDVEWFKVRPYKTCYDAAKKHVITSYHRLITLNDMLCCLADGFPFVFGIPVFESFESEEVAKTGIVPMPSHTEKNLGGHALCAVGYLREAQCFIVRNSWSEKWADRGYCYIPFDYLETMADDFWTIRK